MKLNNRTTVKRRKTAILLLVVFGLQIFHIPVSYALTSGPSQPEVQSFEPASTTEMVDIFSGDFTYNIPLFELPGPNGGYPFNLAYHGGVRMDQEASWTGLGWNLNPGAINRQMRGLPDDFKGDQVHSTISMKPSITAGVGGGIGAEIFGGAANGELGLSIFHNNYKGVGYSIDGSVGFSKSAQSGPTAGVGLGFSLNSQEGVFLNPSLSLSGNKDNLVGTTSIGFGYSSREGLQNISVGFSAKESYSATLKDGKNIKGSKNNISSNSSLSLSSPGFTPKISLPMRNSSTSLKLKFGGAWWGVYGHGFVKGFYNKQQLKNNGDRVPSSAFGYLNYQHAEEADLLDFNREKDGIVRKESPNLPIPSLTYDIYSVNGQGMSAMYRPIRNDVGIVYDQLAESDSKGFSLGGDVGPALAHVGANLSLLHTDGRSGKWIDNNQLIDNVDFIDWETNKIAEPWHFKVHGEHTSQPFEDLNKVGGDKAVKLSIGGSRSSPVAVNQITGAGVSTDLDNDFEERKSRNQVVSPITNEELLSGSTELVSLFKIFHQNSTGGLIPYNRSANPGHHIAGFTSINEAGLRYVYALPAYNKVQQEMEFSVARQTGDHRVSATSGNGDFSSETEIPEYAYSYMLTSIVGPDYVDVTGNGVTPDDLGYWVKFTYQQSTTPTNLYKWRTPFSEASYSEGLYTKTDDNRATYLYGEKEIWYLESAETKSHIAKFVTTLKVREDARGASNIRQNANTLGHRSKSLDEIVLFSRFAGVGNPIKKVKLDYDYELANGVDNSQSGKLTLQSLAFEYGNSSKGGLTPYEFDYRGINPNYNSTQYDRWGNYKPGTFADNRDYPYVDQNPDNKDEIDQNAAAWNLTNIKLPSGGEIIVDYESDDYGYVQHMPAMQMMELVDPADNPQSTYDLADDQLKVKFKLETPIPEDELEGFNGSLSAAQLVGLEQKEVKKYLDLNRDLYFRVKVNLRGRDEIFHEFISGYASIDQSKDPGLVKVGNNYEYGYFFLLAEKGDKGNFHHPFSLRAWQHLRTNQPELTNITGNVSEPGESIGFFKGLLAIVPQIRKLFEGFNDYAILRGWGREVLADKSRIRLFSPDKIKYGGGHRVKQVTFKDNWTQGEEAVYGQVYDYSMEEDGRKISSGVAAFEPGIGGEENALRYAKKYTQSIPLHSDNNLFFEYPINESYYPAAQVGYRKVTVKSLASAILAGEDVEHTDRSSGGSLFPTTANASFTSSGQKVYEFYTAKDFPVITDETSKTNKPYRLFIPVPLLGTISASKLTSSQGYSVVTNDMHGKLRKVSDFRQNAEGEFENTPVSYVLHNYLNKERYLDKRTVQVPLNAFEDLNDGTLSVAASNTPNSQKVLMGTEQEFFLDMRQNTDNTFEGGVNANVDILIIPLAFITIPFPLPSVWPNVSKDERELKTVVTNKVIFKSGILESTEVFNEGSLIKTKNLKWDKLTGNPILQVVNNNFDDPVYSLTQPAYQYYPGMGPAYENIGFEFTVISFEAVPNKNDLFDVLMVNSAEENIFPGDEVILYDETDEGDMGSARAFAVYLGNDTGSHRFYCQTSLPDDAYVAKIMRSGKRNQLSASAGNITALSDPTREGTPVEFNAKILVPE